jgi:hypothetical protein
MWFRRRREQQERIERALEAIIQKLSAEPVAPKVDATAVLAEAFGHASHNQTEFIGALSELALKSSARRMGIRGGTKRALTADRQSDGKFARAKRITDERKLRCRLCKDPMIRDPQIWEIQQHRMHEGQRAEGDYVNPEIVDPTNQPEPGPSSNYSNGASPA